MSKCTVCRKGDAKDTIWERMGRFLMHKLFPERIIDLSQDMYTKGFGCGYEVGFKHARENQKN